MKKFFALFILLLIFISCSKSEFNIQERKDDINAIITTIIETDRIDIEKNNIEKNTMTQFFKKIKIITPKPEEIRPINENERTLDWILNFNLKKPFSKNDSIYLLSQNINPDTLEISNELKSRYNFSNLPKILLDRKNKKYYQYYEFSIPVFSADHKTAYIELDYHSKGYFGQGMAYILKKENNKWKILESGGTWIN
ncbi:hypothetical protein [Chryseobacterium sp. MMS23-Vi53]|uniref:hypothetical protein n=1 Tax=Chryseobacterium sp. MMS23-Vi53 TaxID=3386644 RepID=UPI0039EBC784